MSTLLITSERHLARGQNVRPFVQSAASRKRASAGGRRGRRKTCVRGRPSRNSGRTCGSHPDPQSKSRVPSGSQSRTRHVPPGSDLKIRRIMVENMYGAGNNQSLQQQRRKNVVFRCPSFGNFALSRCFLLSFSPTFTVYTHTFHLISNM